MKTATAAPVVACAALLALAAAAARAGSPDAAERAVWERELDYYAAAAANDPDRYLEFFDEDAIGWPALDAAPKGRNRFSQWIARVHEDPSRAWTYELTVRDIQAFGDVVVVHYQLREYFVDRETGEKTCPAEFKIAHTWQYRDGEWRIISGMGGDLAAVLGLSCPE